MYEYEKMKDWVTKNTKQEATVKFQENKIVF
jgi:hypothetical protein